MLSFAWPARGLKSLTLGLMIAGGGAVAADMAAGADMPRFVQPHAVQPQLVQPYDPYAPCGVHIDRVALFDHKGRPTVPARTPFFYCLTGYTLVPGDIPPPPEYCCR
jgi:hypothetical protein